MIEEKSEPKVKKPAKFEHLANWFWGNSCANCGVIDGSDYGIQHRENIQTIAKKLKEKEYLK